jgi:hypothetical protein
MPESKPYASEDKPNRISQAAERHITVRSMDDHPSEGPQGVPSKLK